MLLPNLMARTQISILQCKFLRNFLLPVDRLWRHYGLQTNSTRTNKPNTTQINVRDDYVARLASKLPHSLSLADLVK